jgi:hypothetical protein
MNKPQTNKSTAMNRPVAQSAKAGQTLHRAMEVPVRKPDQTVGLAFYDFPMIGVIIDNGRK